MHARDDRDTSTKVKNPTLAQTARMGPGAPSLMLFKGGGVDLIPDDGRRIETLIGAYWLVLDLPRLFPTAARAQHDSRQKRILLLRIDSGDGGRIRTKVKNPTLAQTARMRHLALCFDLRVCQ
jgi:hypothetical protein